MSIKRRLQYTFLGALSILLVVLLILLIRMGRVVATNTTHDEENHRVTELINNMSHGMERIRVFNLSHVLLADPAKMDKVERERRAEIDRLGELEARLREVDDPSIKPRIDAFLDQADTFVRLSHTTIALSRNGAKQEATAWVRNMVTPAYNAAEEQSAFAKSAIRIRTRNLANAVAKANRDLILVVLAGIMAGAILAQLAFRFGLRWIIEPINHLTQAARRVTAGDYEVTLDIRGPDEMVVMTKAFNEMIRNQKRRFNELHGLLEVSAIVLSSLDLQTVFKRILTSGYLLGAEEGMVVLFDPAGGKTRVALNNELSLCDCILPPVNATAPSLVSLPADKPESEGCNECLKKLGFNHALIISMGTSKKALGYMIFLTRQEDGFDKHEIDLAIILSNHGAVAIENARLFTSLWENYRNIVVSLATAVDAKSEFTGEHGYQSVKFAEMVSARLELPADISELVRGGCLLHDVGKIGIRDEILNKPGKLTPEEFEEIKKHSVIGAEIMTPRNLDDTRYWEMGPLPAQDPAEFLKQLSLVIRHHHERFDGTGYPDGLKGEEIPLAARVVAMVDAYEAMITDRPYRKAMTPADAVRELRRCAGKQFDPRVVKAFISVLETQGEAVLAGGPLGKSAVTRDPS